MFNLSIYSFIFELQQFFNPEVSFDFMNKFFGFVKEKVTRDYDQCIYKFEWNPTARSYGACGPEVTIKYEEMDANSDYAFLQDWFVSGMTESA